MLPGRASQSRRSCRASRIDDIVIAFRLPGPGDRRPRRRPRDPVPGRSNGEAHRHPDPRRRNRPARRPTCPPMNDHSRSATHHVTRVLYPPFYQERAGRVPARHRRRPVRRLRLIHRRPRATVPEDVRPRHRGAAVAAGRRPTIGHDQRQPQAAPRGLDRRGRPDADRPLRRGARERPSRRPRRRRPARRGRSRRRRRGPRGGRHPRLRQPGRRGQPRRRPHGPAAGRLPGRGRRPDRQPAVRLGAAGDQLGGPCDRGRATATCSSAAASNR